MYNLEVVDGFVIYVRDNVIVFDVEFTFST